MFRSRQPQLRRLALGAGAVTVSLALAACNQSAGGGGGGTDTKFPSETIQFMVPSGAGGGWDTTARSMQAVLEEDDLVNESIEVFNVEGGGGATGLAQLQQDKGDPHAWMMTGLVMIGALEQAGSQLTLDDTSPIATLTAEAEAFVVPANSEFQTINDVVEAYQANPKSVNFGGGSAGGSDQLVVADLLNAAGADASQMTYVGYPGGGEAIAGILSGDVAVGVSGVSEFEEQIAAGKMRLLAISTAEPQDVAGEPAPTLAEAGYDVDFSNWRALVAAPGLSDDQVSAITKTIDEMHGTAAWEQTLEENGWTDFYQTGQEAKDFFDSETKRVADLYADLGL